MLLTVIPDFSHKFPLVKEKRKSGWKKKLFNLLNFDDISILFEIKWSAIISMQ